MIFRSKQSETKGVIKVDKEKILRLCNQIEMIIVTICNTGYTIQPGDEEAIFNRTKAIMDEVSTPPKSNGDRIRQMTDEGLADFLNTLKYNCCDGKCGDCPVSGYEDVEGDCSVEEWLKRQIEEETS